MEALGLRKFSLLKEFSDSELESLASSIEICNYSSDTIIIAEGGTDTDFYLVDRGALSVIKAGVSIAWLGEGDYFGEMAILDENCRDASIKTLADCLLYRIPYSVFVNKLQPRYEVLFDIVRIQNKRLRHHNALFVSQYDALKSLYTESKKNEDFFRFINEAIYDAVIVFENDQVLFINKKVYDMFGVKQGISFPFSELVKQMTAESLTKFMSKIKESITDIYELEAIRTNGEHFPLEICPTFVNYHGSNLKVLVLRDLSDVRQKEELIKNQKAQIAQSAKMALLGEMVSGIAHELNNPLAIIDGFARMLDKYSTSPEEKQIEIKKASDTILKMTERMNKIIMGLRSFARDCSKDDFEISSISRIINDTLNFIQVKKLKLGIEVIVEETSPELSIQCRSVQIAEVLLNLISNSFDAISELENRWVKIRTEDLDDKVKISVVDSGHGINPETVLKIFEPFFTTKPPGKGTGLGMSISKRIVEDHGGSLIYDSSCPNTCFILILPKVSTLKAAKLV